MVSTFVYFVRHGQTAENLRGIIQGQLDTQLDETGRLQQAPAIADALKDIHFEICFTSDLIRAIDTAEVILRHHPGILLHRSALLRERYMGKLQGQIYVAPERRTGKQPTQDNSVESPVAFAGRTLQFWDKTILPLIEAERPNGDPCHVLVVTHGGFIGTLARSLVGHRNIVQDHGVAFSRCPNVSITLVEIQHGGAGILRSFGDTSHLVKPAVQENADELPV